MVSPRPVPDGLAGNTEIPFHVSTGGPVGDSRSRSAVPGILLGGSMGKKAFGASFHRHVDPFRLPVGDELRYHHGSGPES